MLHSTLGCPETFELRRQELAAVSGTIETDISDQRVVDSFTGNDTSSLIPIDIYC